MKKLLCIILLVLCLCISAFGQFLDSEKMFGQQLNLGHWATEGLVYYFRAIEAGNAVDDSFNELHGTLTGAPVWVGEALSFDGTNDYVSVPSDPRIENFTALTLGAWILVQGNPGVSRGRIIGKDQGGTSDDYALSNADNIGGRNYEILFRLNTTAGTSTPESDSGILPNTGWHFAVATWDGSFQRIYIDGLLDMTPVAHGGTLDDSNLPLGIGGHQASNTRRFNGGIRTAFIYNRALSATEIFDLFINPDLPIYQNEIWQFFSPAVVGDVGIGAGIVSGVGQGIGR